MKNLFFVLIAVLLAGPVFGDKVPFTFGIYGGIGVGNYVKEVDGFDPNEELTPKDTPLSSTFGVRVHYALVDSLDILSGLAYTRRRVIVASADKATGNDSWHMNIARNYLQIPAMLRWGSNFYLAGGGYLAFQLGDAWSENQDVALPDSVQNKTDYGVMAEIGYRFYDTASLAVNMEWGFVNVVEYPSTFSMGFIVKNVQLSLFLAIEFDLLNN